MRIGELINEFFDRRQRGESLSEDTFLAENPDFAEELREHLGGLDLLRGLGSSGDATRVVGTAPGRGSSGHDPFEAPSVPLPEIPGYQILKQIGRGGMGIVYKAIQLSTKRVVALKLLLEGPLASEHSRRRFEREIALAAQLRHPNIIPIYDSGTASGRMYYAMEHVFGLPLTDYLRAHALDAAAKLRLFVKLAEPVGHAHMRGVIHRDLKPSNILIDGNGEPHILDFGLAKAGSLIDSTTSITAQIVGTPAYMSPEQASGDPNGIDTRVDVYALGVVLYEMLTDRMPYDTNVAMGKILQNIAHAEPAPPQRVNSKLDADISAIVVKALEKRREDRYQSVDAFAGDVKRYLAGEPITAKPASTMYLLKKVAWKHRTVVGISAGLIVIATAMLLTINHFSRQLKEKAVRLEQQAVEVNESREALARKQQEVERLAREQEEARRAYQIAKASMPPEMQKIFDTVVTAGASGTGRPEEIGIKLVAEALTNQLVGSGTETPSFKKAPYDPREPSMSRRPDVANRADESSMTKDQILSEIMRLAGAFVSAPGDAPTSQPTTTQPTDPRNEPTVGGKTSTEPPAAPEEPS